MKKAFIIFIFTIISIHIFGNEIDTTIAKQVAYHYFTTKTNSCIQKNANDFCLVYQAISLQKSGNNRPLYYIFNTGNKGFIIVSADDHVKPILAYSTESTFDTSTISPATKSWLYSYQKEIEYVIENNIASTPAIDQTWQDLKNDNVVKINGIMASKSPLITTKWGQGNRYNSLCPYDATQRAYCVTGCVVVAMSQVMNFWKHPTKGLGSNSYIDNPYGVLSANFENTTYLYDSMPSMLSYQSSTNQIRAIATLMFHCGVAIEIEYGVNGSEATLAEYTAGSPSGELALKTYFGYPDIIGLDRSHYSDSSWIAIIKNEIDSGRPVIYRGTGDVGGHVFILDAYNDTDYFHVNWGWTGYGDGYYSVSALNPFSYSFPNGHYCLINVKPTTNMVYPDSNHIVYISPTGAGKKDGSSWDDASPNLSFAVKRQYANPTQIWVKAGSYYGDTSLGTAFQIAANNKVYGGFEGNEPPSFDLNLRNFTSNTSILDGQHLQRVVSTSGSTDTNRSICDGFIIQNGYTTTGGAGVYMNGGKLSNCIIRNNINDSSYGGGVYVKSKAMLVNCLIHNNKGIFGGGVIIWDSTYFTNCTFANNTATSNGGGLYVCDTAFAVNCIFWGNKRNTSNNQISSNSNTLTDISYSAIQGNYSGINNINLSSSNNGADTLYYVRFTNPTAYNYTLQSSSCCINAGDSNKNINAIDLAGLRRIKNGKIDMGAYEYGCYTNQSFDETICSGNTYNENGFNFTPTQQGNFTLVEKLISPSDCDSILTLHLTVIPTDTIHFEDGICLGEAYHNFGFDTIPNQEGILILYKVFTNSYGCDSIIQLTLHVTKIDSTVFNDIICYGETYTKNGFAIQSDTLNTGYQDFSYLTSNMYGCDSLIILHLFISNLDSTHIYDSICHGFNYTENGFKINTGIFQVGTIIRQLNLLNQYGCDSSIILHLNILPTHDSTIKDIVYKGDIYNKYGFLINTDTVEIGTFTTENRYINRFGCDSTVHLQLTVNVGIDEIINENYIRIFPNPANENIEIQYISTNQKDFILTISDITGKILKIENLKTHSTRINISDLAKGMYFLTFERNNQPVKTLKIIKQ